MVRVELGSGLDQRSRQAILAYIGSGHRSEVQTPTTSLRYVFLLLFMLICPQGVSAMLRDEECGGSCLAFAFPRHRCCEQVIKPRN